MSKFPVEISDQAGIVDAVNYVLSGPTYPDTSAQGFSTDQTSDMTGNFREPWTGVGTGILYVAPIALTSTTWLDDYTLRFDFAAAQPTPPFSLGNVVYTAGITPAGSMPVGYNGYSGAPGVVECSTTYVIIRTRKPQPNLGAGTGGTIEFSAADPTLDPTIMSTDCNTKVTVNYANSQVAINAQLENTITYSTIGATQALYQVQINRYKGFPTNDPINPGFYFQYDGNVALKEYLLDLTDTTNNITSIAIDPAPPPPYTNTRTQAALTYPETYFVVNTATTGSGSGVRLNVKIAAGFPAAPPQLYTAANTTIEIVEAGQDYQVGDLVIIDGADIGGVTGVDDLVLIIGAVGIPNPDLFYANTFTGVVDRPEIGYYWYILEIYFETITGDLYIHRCRLGQRSLTAQVIKQ